MEYTKLLVEAGADVNVQSLLGETALLRATYHGHKNIIKLLVDAGADVNAANNEGNTVLHRLAKFSLNQYDPEFLKKSNLVINIASSANLFLKSGCFINKKNNTGRNALEKHVSNITFCYGPKLMELLFAAGEIFEGDIPKGYGSFLEDCKEISLKSICRGAVRNYLIKLNPNVNLFLRIPELGLPALITNYLLYNVSVNDEKDSLF